MSHTRIKPRVKDSLNSTVKRKLSDLMIVISDNEEDQQSRNSIKEVIDHLESKWDKGGTLGAEGLKNEEGVFWELISSHN